ncbi:hypothetical protein [Muricoccus radiodurans]|uniref:hypothetical protein n=1 Tax=Muricoccus radiodurans TaxID=2231721 RepID=UPI003CFA33BD
MSDTPRPSPAPEMPKPTSAEDRKKAQDEELDEALEETFPASDPVSTLRED